MFFGYCGICHDGKNDVMIFIFCIFIATITKPFAGYFMPLRICTLYFTGLMYENILILVNTWEFDPTSSCVFPSWVILVWMLVSSCLLRSKWQYWKLYYGLSMELSR